MTVIACSPEYAKLIGNLFAINPGYLPAMTMPTHPPGGQARALDWPSSTR
jgi:hypothetical protein